MIVYGDPSFQTSWNLQQAHFKARLEFFVRFQNPSLDDLRTLLIQAGQLEQAAHDALFNTANQALIIRFQSITDAAANAFLARWLDSQGDLSIVQPDLPLALEKMARAIESVPDLDWQLTVKVPEGFAFYTLFPEAYCAAALSWLTKNAGESPRRAAIIGIRSIGTTLSALVAATLQASGWQAVRFTLRPSGHPFSREAQIEARELNGAKWVLIVDEGPGLSGSSMASVAQAAHRAGLARENISFLPGHGGEPGEKASSDVRAWWKVAPRFVTPLHELRWNAGSLSESLAALTPLLCSTDDSVERIEDLSGGAWRQVVYHDQNEWPDVAAPFERTKFRVTLRSGQAVLWKFAGFDAQAMQKEVATRSAGGWSPTPLGTALGFGATRWIEGEPLAISDETPSLLTHIGRYISAVSTPPLSDLEQKTAVERLQEMLFFNTKEALGETAARRTQKWSALDWALQTGPRSYGDGHLAPHEWIRTPDGRILKTDGFGHSNDHTMIGRQSLAWDVAGAIIEWNLSDASAAFLVACLNADGNADGSLIPPDALRFYCLAYAAFRLGQSTLCASLIAPNETERARLQRAGDFYRQELARRLE